MKGEFILDHIKQQQNEREILHISIGQAVPGMKVAKDVYTKNNQLVLAKNKLLDANMIAKIMFYTVQDIYIYQPEEQFQEKFSYYERIQRSSEFINFHAVYREVLNEIKEKVHQVLIHKIAIDEKQLLHIIKKVVTKGKGRYHFLELIYSIQEFDDMTFAHSINVALICNMFAHWLHMDEADCDTLTLCGLLHDVGKLTVPKEILSKADKLTPNEYAIVKEHTKAGNLILLEQNVDPRVRMAALQHHERQDGSGYPMNKRGDEIHPFSMITAIADVFDAMTSNRVYRNAICPFSVLAMFEEEGKCKFDLTIAMPIMERIAEIYINHTVLLNNKSKGEVIMVNCHALSRPVIKVSDVFIDLSKHHDLSIEAVV